MREGHVPIQSHVFRDDNLTDIIICPHPALFNKICVSCGQKMNVETPVGSMTLKDDSQWKNKLSISTHTIFLNDSEAQHVQESKSFGLLRMKKLALILDLDNTIIHATSVYPQKFSDNIFHIQFSDPTGLTNHWIKIRPYTVEFLKEVSKYCQLSIYTHGTRPYAEKVVNILDPDGMYFNKRMISRTDVPDLGSEKSIERMFLKDSSMVLVMDDRSDVWRGHQQMDHLLLVQPYVFFNDHNYYSNNSNIPSSHTPLISIHDNNNNLIKENEILLTPSSYVSNKINDKNMNIESNVNIIANDNQYLNNNNNNNSYSLNENVIKENTLSDDEYDDQLLLSLEIIKNIHHKFFSKRNNSIDDNNSEYTSTLTKNNNNNSSQDHHRDHITTSTNVNDISSKYSIQNDHDDSESRIPESVADIIRHMRHRILSGVHIVFSGVIPSNCPNPQEHDLWYWAESMGAYVTQDIEMSTTHVIAIGRGTQKFITASRRGDIWIVHMDWLRGCIWRMKRLKELRYLLAPPPEHPNLNPIDTSRRHKNVNANNSNTMLVEEQHPLVDEYVNSLESDKIEKELGEIDPLGLSKKRKYPDLSNDPSTGVGSQNRNILNQIETLNELKSNHNEISRGDAKCNDSDDEEEDDISWVYQLENELTASKTK